MSGLFVSVSILMVCALTLAVFFEKPMEIAFMEQVSERAGGRECA